MTRMIYCTPHSLWMGENGKYPMYLILHSGFSVVGAGKSQLRPRETCDNVATCNVRDWKTWIYYYIRNVPDTRSWDLM